MLADRWASIGWQGTIRWQTTSQTYWGVYDLDLGQAFSAQPSTWAVANRTVRWE